MSDTEKNSTAKAPFDNQAVDCDIILRSADGVDFHVFKLILSLVSPVFQGMFMLPQDTSQSDVSSIPIVPMTESSTVLESLLLLCYPAATPTFKNLEDAKAVLDAARKYVMITALSRAKDLVFGQFMLADPLGLYALSCMFGWQQHARVAATQTLEINLKDLGRPGSEFAGMRDISAFDYHKLLVYHYDCGVVAQAVGDSLSWLGSSSNDMCMWRCGSGRACQCASTKSLHIAKLGKLLITPWFDEYIVSSGKELYARPCGSILLESASYNRAINKALACSYCRSTVVDSMEKFRKLYVAQVKKVIANVRLRAE